jgi:hypothetical protein
MDRRDKRLTRSRLRSGWRGITITGEQWREFFSFLYNVLMMIIVMYLLMNEKVRWIIYDWS